MGLFPSDISGGGPAGGIIGTTPGNDPGIGGRFGKFGTKFTFGSGGKFGRGGRFVKFGKGGRFGRGGKFPAGNFGRGGSPPKPGSGGRFMILLRVGS